jgi:hypothetical protein
MVRGSEIALQWEVFFKRLVAMEFSSVVESDCLEGGFVFLDSIQGGLCNGGGGSRLQLFDDSEAGLSFNESEKAVMAIAADHSVSFPVAELQTGFDHRRPLRDMAFAWQNSA